jgi:hypothetical protein
MLMTGSVPVSSPYSDTLNRPVIIAEDFRFKRGNFKAAILSGFALMYGCQRSFMAIEKTFSHQQWSWRLRGV